MRYSICIIIGILSLCQSVFAHDSKEAFFSIRQAGDLSVEAEFSWVLRNAVQQFDSTLSDQTTKEAVDKITFRYFRENFKLFSSNAELNPILTIKEVKHQGHSHSAVYLFRFKNPDFERLENTLLFNINEKQTNYHTLTSGGKTSKFKTTKTTPSYQKPAEDSYLQSPWYLLLIIPVLVFLIRLVSL